jgi:hypothetical protein
MSVLRCIVFIYGLFKDCVISLHYVASNGRMIMNGKEAWFKVRIRCLGLDLNAKPPEYVAADHSVATLGGVYCMNVVTPVTSC